MRISPTLARPIARLASELARELDAEGGSREKAALLASQLLGCCEAALLRCAGPGEFQREAIGPR